MNDSLTYLFRGISESLLKAYILRHYITRYEPNLQFCTCILQRKPGLIFFLKVFDKPYELMNDPRWDWQLPGEVYK